MQEVEWQNLAAPALRRLAEQDAIVIVPIGSTEQHGPHLPVQVDSLIAGEVAKRAAVRLSGTGPVVVTPTVWTGLAEHHMAFGATITLDFSTFHALLRCICRSVLRHGFRRLLLLNGHGGNVAALGVIAGELTLELGRKIAVATYWTLPEAATAFAAILERQPNVRHACEAETSMVLSLRPELVDRDAMKSIEPPADGPAASPFVWREFSEITASGVIGVPSAADADKGGQLLDAAARAVAGCLAADLWEKGPRARD